MKMASIIRAIGLVFMSCKAIAAPHEDHQGGTFGATVMPQAILESVEDISLGQIDLLSQNELLAGVGTFRIRTNDEKGTSYDVYVIAPDPSAVLQQSGFSRFLAKNGSSALPLAYELEGGQGENKVLFTQALSAKPHSGGKPSGLGVKGANARIGTGYVIRLTPKPKEIQGDMKEGLYQLYLSVNVDVQP